MEQFIVDLSGRSNYKNREAHARSITFAGGICHKELSAQTSVLVEARYPFSEQSQRAVYAKANGIPIVSDDDLIRVLNTNKPLSSLLSFAGKFDYLLGDTRPHWPRHHCVQRISRDIRSAAISVQSPYSISF